VPVVKDGKLVGIVSRANLLQAIATIGKTIKPVVTVDDATLREKVIAQLDRQLLTWPSLVNVRRRRDALIDKKCNLDRRIVAVCRLELERVRPVVVCGSTAPAAQAIQ
jgi:RNA-binding protein YhbY